MMFFFPPSVITRVWWHFSQVITPKKQQKTESPWAPDDEETIWNHLNGVNSSILRINDV